HLDAASLDMKPRPLAVDPKSFERSGVLPPRISRAMASETSAEEKPLPSVAEEARVRLIPTPPTGATSRNRPPRGAFLIPRPLAVVGDSHRPPPPTTAPGGSPGSARLPSAKDYGPACPGGRSPPSPSPRRILACRRTSEIPA